MSLRLAALLAVLIGAGWAAPAHACSVIDTYMRPTNFELVQIADAIVVATAEAQAGEETVNFLVEQTVKGTPPERLAISWASIGTPPPSDLTDLSGSNPEGHMGPCNRTSFVRGGRYLLFLGREADGTWRQLGFPFSRVNEDYRGEDTIWMRTVRRYVALQQRLAPMAQIDALSAMQASGRAPDGRSLAPSEQRDIADHLSSISPWKPTAWLVQAYERAERGEAVAMRPDSANRENSNVDALVSMALGTLPPAARPGGSEGVRLAVLSALAAGDHPEAMPLIERLATAPATSAPAQGQVLLYFARNGRFARAYEWIETQLMTRLLRLERDDAMRLLRNVAETMRGDATDETRERWRTDPHAAATWPELALSLYWYQVRTFGEDNAIGFSAVDTIPITDYRARPLLTLRRGADFDEGATRWAIAELSRPLAPANGDVDDETRVAPDLLPLRVLVSAWSEDRTNVLTRLFCQGGLRRRAVILAIGRWGDSLYENLLGGMAGTPNLGDEDKAALLAAAVQMTGRDLEDDRGFGMMAHDPEQWLLTRLARGHPRPPVSALCPA